MINYADMRRSVILFTIAIFALSVATGQEALKSTEEEYYDFLSLQGLVERPYLNYRTLSDSEWTLTSEAKNSDDNIWKNNNLGNKYTLYENKASVKNWFTEGIDESIKLKIYGPEWFNSYNTAAPYGQNDGALWQGKGYNTSFTAGARLEAYGFELTFKPQVCFSQNLDFDYITPNYSGSNYEGKADTYGYYGVRYIDAPQRFGDEPFWTFDWGDSEARYTWHNFTVGFGTQAIWLGPAWLNPIIHSNNAATYPKVDLGLRKTKLYMPFTGWDLGDFEARGWWGKLTESDYFDNDSSNDNNLISGIALAYRFPGILKELSVGFNRTMLSKWDDINRYTIFDIYVPNMQGGDDDSDQRFSLTFDYLLTNVGLDIYFEWARNDFSPSMDYIIRYPFHTQGWTFGIQKAFDLTTNLKLKLLLEVTSLECSADYDRLINWYTTFYCHGIITQGYTNRGQWLGAGIGTGGNSQYLGATLYHKKGSVTLFAQRRNPDLDYTMYIDSRNYAENFANNIWSAEGNIRAILDFGLSTNYFFTQNLLAEASLVFEDERNPLNESENPNKNNAASKHRYNFAISIGAKYNF